MMSDSSPSKFCCHGWRLPSALRRAGLLALLGCAALQLPAQFPPGFGGGAAGTGSNQRSRGSTPTRQYPNNQVGDAVISIDPETRHLIVIADEDTSQYISQVISNLDRPKPDRKSVV